jgi:hypothetical protein
MSPQLGGNWTTFSTLFYKPCFEVAETSMNGFLSVVSVFIAGRHCATAAKLGMQSTIDLGSWRGESVVQLVSIFCTNICPAQNSP